MLDQVASDVETLERHVEILEHVDREQPIGIINLADETGYPHHKIRYSLRVLEENGAIEPTKRGAVTADREDAFGERFDERLDEVIDRLVDLHSKAPPVA